MIRLDGVVLTLVKNGQLRIALSRQPSLLKTWNTALNELSNGNALLM